MTTEKAITLTARIQLQVPAATRRDWLQTLANDTLQHQLISRLSETVAAVMDTVQPTSVPISLDLHVPALPKPRSGSRLPTPKVRAGLLTWFDPFEQRTNTVGSVGSLQWWDWLKLDWAASFRYQDQHGSFTAIRENRRGCHVWYAHRRQRGKLKRLYLGKSDNLTADKLAHVAKLISLPPETGQPTLLSSGGDA